MFLIATINDEEYTVSSPFQLRDGLNNIVNAVHVYMMVPYSGKNAYKAA